MEEDEQQRRKEVEWASRQQIASMIQRQFERDCLFFAAQVGVLVEHPRPLAAARPPHDREQERLNRVHWYQQRSP